MKNSKKGIMLLFVLIALFLTTLNAQTATVTGTITHYGLPVNGTVQVFFEEYDGSRVVYPVAFDQIIPIIGGSYSFTTLPGAWGWLSPYCGIIYKGEEKKVNNTGYTIINFDYKDKEIKEKPNDNSNS